MIRRVIALLCVILSVSVLLIACEDNKPDGELTPVKDENGAITGYERKYHNDNGGVTRWDVYDAQQQYDHYILYEYDSNDRMAKETYYQADGIGVYYYAYSYDDEGNLAEEDYASAKNGSTRTLYTDGKESIRYTYDTNDDLVKYEENIDGAWVEKDLPTVTDETVDATE